MNLSRLFSAFALPSLVVIGSVVATPALAQQSRQAPTVQSPAARGAARGPATEGHFGRGRGHRGDQAATPEQRAERRVQHMVERLSLDTAQAAQLRQILSEGHAQREALASERLTGEQLEARHRQLREASGQRIRAILRADQQSTFDTFAQRRAERGERGERGVRGHHGPRGERGGHGPGPGRMLESLGLDEAQRTAAQQIFAEGRAQHEALRGQALTREERHARHRQIMEANGQRVRALLTAEQQRAFDQRATEMRQRFEARRGAAATSTPRSGI